MGICKRREGGSQPTEMPGWCWKPGASPRAERTLCCGTWVSFVPGLALASNEDEHRLRQFTVLLAICVVLLYSGFSARVIPKLHFPKHITSLVSSDG